VSDEPRNLAAVERMYKAFSTGDIATLLDMLADDVVWENPGPEEFEYFGTKHGRAQVARTFEFVGSRMGVTRFEPQHRFAEGPKVFSILAIEGIATPSGKAWGGRVLHEFTFGAGGNVVAFCATQDNYRLANALA
jgi:ketosteroid isomerase-like protein